MSNPDLRFLTTSLPYDEKHFVKIRGIRIFPCPFAVAIHSCRDAGDRVLNRVAFASQSGIGLGDETDFSPA
jgi:hypothetical protein